MEIRVFRQEDFEEVITLFSLPTGAIFGKLSAI